MKTLPKISMAQVHLAMMPAAEPAQPKPDDAIDVEAMACEWRQMADTHDIFRLVQRFGAGRTQAYRLVPDDLARQVDVGAFSRLLIEAAATGEPVMIFVGSPGNVPIHIGEIHCVERRGPWQNLLDDGFNLHLLEEGIDSCWVVRKPAADGWIASLEIFDAAGGQTAWIFGKRRPGSPRS